MEFKQHLGKAWSGKYSSLLLCCVSCNTGLQWLGQRVRVFWKDDFMWYNGCIDDHYGGDRYHILYDDDGFEEWICLPSVFLV